MKITEEMKRVVDRFESAVKANGYRTRDDVSEVEYEAARKGLYAALKDFAPVPEQTRTQILKEASVVVGIAVATETRRVRRVVEAAFDKMLNEEK